MLEVEAMLNLTRWYFGLCIIALAFGGTLFCCWWLLVKAIRMLEK